MISLRLLSTRYIVLNSLKTTKDLLEKMSAITSDRPHFTMAGDLVGLGNATFFLEYGDTLRKHRKFFTRHIGANSSLVTFHPAEEAEARRFVINVLKNPDDLIAYCYRYSVNCPSSGGANVLYIWSDRLRH